MKRLIYTIIIFLCWTSSTQAESISESIMTKHKESKFGEIDVLPRSNGVCPRVIGNLVNNFPSCLISIYNNHHIDLESTNVPVLQKRFAHAGVANSKLSYGWVGVTIWYNGKSVNDTSIKDIVHQYGLYMKSKWTCSIGVSVCNAKHNEGFNVEPYPGRENIGGTSPQIPGTMFDDRIRYATLFPRSKVTLPTLLFLVLEVDMKIQDVQDRDYSFTRGASLIAVVTKINKRNSRTITNFLYETRKKQFIKIQPSIRELTVQEITKHIYYPPKTIQVVSPSHYTGKKSEWVLSKSLETPDIDWRMPIGLKYFPAEYSKEAKRILTLPTTITDQRMIHYMRPSILESIDLFVDGILVQAVSPNISKIFEYGSQSSTPLIRVQIYETNYQLAFVTSAEEFRFVSCGKPEKSPVDFAVYVSPFDLHTWMMLLTANFILSVIITTNNHGSVSEGLLRGFVILVEQGDAAVINTKRIPFLYWICGPWILITLIMTNAYKGENITKLLAPYKSIPYENFSQLVNHNFTIFTDITEIHQSSTASAVLPYFYFLMSGMKNWDKHYSPQWKKPVQRILKGREGRYKDVSFNQSRQELIACKRSAYVGWTSETTQLYETVSLMFPEYKDEKLYIGKEVLFKQNRGWEIDFLNDESIYTKLSILQESGIAQRFSTLLLNAKRFHNINVLNATNKPHREVKGISIKGNIFTVFLLVIGLFSFVLLILTVEILMTFFVVRIIPHMGILMRRCRTEFLTLLRKHQSRWSCQNCSTNVHSATHFSFSVFS